MVFRRAFSQKLLLLYVIYIDCLSGWFGTFGLFVHHIFWVNYNDLTTTSLGIMVSKGNHPQMGLIQVSELL